MTAAHTIQDLIRRRRPGYTLEAEFYTSKEIFDLDMDIIFGRYWLFVAVEAEIPEPGDYLMREIGRDSIVIVRDDDGMLRSHFNVCRHRGARLVNTPSGTVGKLVCPYHQWTYELTGELVHAEHMGDGFDAGCRNLKPVHVRSIEGLIFVCLGNNPPADIDDMERQMAARLAPHDLRNTKVAKQIDIVEQGNWKLVLENNRECYHCLSNHPELTVSLFQFGYGFEPDANDAQCVADQAAYDAEQKRMVEDWERRGYPSRPLDHLGDRPTGFRSERLILAGTGESQTFDTKVACRKLLGTLDDPKMGGLHYWTQPNSWHHFMSDHAITFSVLPLDPERSLLRTTWLVHKDAVEGVDYDVDNLTRVWDATNGQDSRLVGLTQTGARSSAYEPGPYSPLTEDFVNQGTTWYIDQMARHLGR
jgi:glycine betaine catabolism A